MQESEKTVTVREIFRNDSIFKSVSVRHQEHRKKEQPFPALIVNIHTWNSDKNESPMMMEYASEPRKQRLATTLVIIQDDDGDTDFDHASWKFVTLCRLHTFPITLKLYAAIDAKAAHASVAGRSA